MSSFREKGRNAAATKKPRDDNMLKASSRLPKTREITNDRVTAPSDRRACMRMKMATTPDTKKGQT